MILGNVGPLLDTGLVAATGVIASASVVAIGGVRELIATNTELLLGLGLVTTLDFAFV